MDNIIFRELMAFNAVDSPNLDKVLFNNINRVELSGIWTALDSDARFTPIRNLQGYYYYVEVYKYQGVDMVSEGADLVKLYTEKLKHPEVVYESVFHPNGNLCGSWVDSEDILDVYKEDR